MLVNVYTYYENRLALQRVRPRRRPVFRRPSYGFTGRGARVGALGGALAWGLGIGPVQPLLLFVLLTAWGMLAGAALDWAVWRLVKVGRALRGQRLGSDDFRVLCN